MPRGKKKVVKEEVKEEVATNEPLILTEPDC